MPLSKLEMIAGGLMLLGAASAVEGHIGSNRIRAQIRPSAEVTQAEQIRAEMTRLASIPYEKFYDTDPRGQPILKNVTVTPEITEGIKQALYEYRRLEAEYNALISQPNVGELMAQNYRLTNEAMDYALKRDIPAVVLIGAGGWAGLISAFQKLKLHRKE